MTVSRIHTQIPKQLGENLSETLAHREKTNPETTLNLSPADPLTEISDIDEQIDERPWEQFPKKSLKQRSMIAKNQIDDRNSIHSAERIFVKDRLVKTAQGLTIGLSLRDPSEQFPGIIIDDHQPKHISLPQLSPHDGGHGTKFKSSDPDDLILIFKHLLSTDSGSFVLNRRPINDELVQSSTENTQIKGFDIEDLPSNLEKKMLPEHMKVIRVNTAWNAGVDSWEIHISPGKLPSKADPKSKQ